MWLNEKGSWVHCFTYCFWANTSPQMENVFNCSREWFRVDNKLKVVYGHKAFIVKFLKSAENSINRLCCTLFKVICWIYFTHNCLFLRPLTEAYQLEIDPKYLQPFSILIKKNRMSQMYHHNPPATYPPSRLSFFEVFTLKGTDDRCFSLSFSSRNHAR